MSFVIARVMGYHLQVCVGNCLNVCRVESCGVLELFYMFLDALESSVVVLLLLSLHDSIKEVWSSGVDGD